MAIQYHKQREVIDPPYLRKVGELEDAYYGPKGEDGRQFFRELISEEAVRAKLRIDSILTTLTTLLAIDSFFQTTNIKSEITFN